MSAAVLPYRWRLSGSFLAHLFKAIAKQHHRDLAAMLARLVPPGGIVFDIGAHAGQFMKLFAAMVGPGRVYAVEPGSYARSILRTTVWLHRIGNVAILPLAVGAAPGMAVLSLPRKASGAVGFGLAHLGRPGRASFQEIVAEVRLDDIVAGLGLDRLDFIKADIEGWELRLLHGASETLARFRPRLLLELVPDHLARAGDAIGDVAEFFAARNYRAFAHGPGDALRPADMAEGGDLWLIPAEDAVLGRLPIAG